jgi:putative copper resistance protein D
VLAVRALAFVAALHAAGVPLFLFLFEESLPRVREAVRLLAVRSAWIGIALVVLYELGEPARLTGDLAGVLDLSLQGALLESPLGTATAIRVAGLLCVAVGCVYWARRGALLASIGSTLVVASFAFMGHTAEEERRWLTASALIVHLSVVAFWFGSLLPLNAASRLESLETNARLIERFSHVAVRSVPAIFAAGAVLSAALLPSLASLRTGYGALLLCKVAGFSALMAAAAYNRQRLGPAVKAGRPRALARFGQVVLAEWVTIAVVVALTATMTGAFSPAH